MKSINRLLGLFLLFLASSCVSVKEYQKVYVNDEEMKLSQRSIEQFEASFENYREGASGGKVERREEVVDATE